MGHSIGFSCLLLAMGLSVITCGWCVLKLWRNVPNGIGSIAKLQSAIFALILISSAILAAALLRRDFSYMLVADYTDSLLPWTYALTAFWAGQAGSFLFWTLALALFGLCWSWSRAGRSMSASSQCAFWMVYAAVQAFFLLILTTVSNPFLQLSPSPADGNGLNPLLQHPGMIFHPPLLFIGYAGLTIPAAAGLATVLARDDAWLDRVRNWTLVAWAFLTAGIILGAWWSYMELGWGGYWAWDPVENASLIPWLVSSAFVHTAIIGRKGKALSRTNTALAGLSFGLCLLATFITRSGVLNSLHAFGDQGVGTPLLWGMITLALVTLLATLGTQSRLTRSLPTMASQQGVMVFVTWLLLFVGGVIILGTLWPVISQIWTSDKVGMGPDFYNRVTLPFLALIVLGLPFCPWLGWTTWKRNRRALTLVLGLVVLVGAVLWTWGIRNPLPLGSAALAIAAVLSLLALCLFRAKVRGSRSQLAVMGVHIGLALLAFGVAVSGPYKQEKEAVLNPGQEMHIGEYTVRYESLHQKQTRRMQAVQARVQVTQDGNDLGQLKPERRMYRNFDQPFAEAAVIPGLVDEVYATLLGFDRNEQIRLQIRINPCVNWIWIGGTLMSLAGLMTLRSRPKLQEQAE